MRVGARSESLHSLSEGSRLKHRWSSARLEGRGALASWVVVGVSRLASAWALATVSETVLAVLDRHYVNGLLDRDSDVLSLRRSDRRGVRWSIVGAFVEAFVRPFVIGGSSASATASGISLVRVC